MAEKYIVITNKLEIELKKMRTEGKTKLPSEQTLARQYSCSRQTIRSSLDILQKAGLIEKRTGSGSYIVEDTQINKTVFFITEDCDRYLSPLLINGLRSALASSKYSLQAFSTFGSGREEASLISRAIEEKVCALVIEPSRDLIPNANDRLIEDALASRIPVIYLNSSCAPDGVINIAPNYREAGKSLTEKLISNGRRKTACIFCSDSSAGMDEYKGYIDAVAPFDERRCLLISYKEEKEILGGQDSVLTPFIDDVLCDDCDSVICENGMIAHRLVSLLNKSGKSVPADITVACFDNGYYALNADVPVISFGYDNDYLCKKLAKTCVSLAEGGEYKLFVVPMSFKG